MSIEIILAMIGIITSGAAAGLIARVSSGGRSYRKELRDHINKLETRIDVLVTKVQVLEDEADLWKTKYFDLVFGIKAYRLRIAQLALEHHVPAQVINAITTDEELDSLIQKIEKV